MHAPLVRPVAGFVCALFLAVPLRAGADGQANRPSQTHSADEWVTTQIQAKYFLDPDIKIRTINVSTINGVVTLTGQVANAQERERASEIASRVAGVRNVDNRLTTEAQDVPAGTSGRTPPPAGSEQIPGGDEIQRVTQSDPVILSQIKAKYAVDPDVSAFGVDVDVEDGVVTLRGDVTSGSIRQRAEALAREIRGVKSVKNELRVKQ